MKSKILAILNACLWVTFLSLMLTGLIMKFRISPEDGADLMWHGVKYQEMGEFHFFVACAVIALIAGHLWLNRAWLTMWLKQKKNIFLLIAIVGIIIPLVAFAEPATEGISGNYAATGSVSTLDTPITSLGHRVGITFKPSAVKGNFDYRAESYTESSFHGAGGSLVNERKLETQFSYSRPISNTISVNGGILYHENNTFPDTYFWAIGGISASMAPTDKSTIGGSISAEKKTDGGRVFFDASGSAAYQFHPLFGAFVNVHRYENLGQFDSSPTQKLEYELGILHTPSQRFNATLSYFHHSQYNDPNDKFAYVRFRVGVNF